MREEKREKETEEDKKVKKKMKKRALLLITYYFVQNARTHIYELDVHSNETILNLSHISSRIPEEEERDARRI